MAAQNAMSQERVAVIRPAVASWLLFLLAALVLIGLDLLDGLPFYIDVDDRMRALQIRDLLNDGQWFDRRMPFIASPASYISPWSRLVDLPYVAIVLALKPLLGFEPAFRFAIFTWPLVLLGIYAFVTIRVISAVSNGPPSWLHIVATAVASMLAILEFVPGRIDHHNVQLILMLTLTAGIVDSKARRGGITMGLATIASLAVGLECVPLLAIMNSGLVLAGTISGGEARRRMVAMGWTLTVVALPASLVLNGWTGTIVTACDAYSMPWIVGLILFGLILAFVPKFWSYALDDGPKHFFPRFLSIALPAAFTASWLAYAYPACRSGPYHMIDPVSKEFWFNRVYQELSASALLLDGQLMIVAVIVVLASISIAALPFLVEKIRTREYGIIVIYGTALLSLILSVAVIRFIRFPAAFVPLFLPVAIECLKKPTGVGGWFAYRIPVFLPVALAIVAVASIPKNKPGAVDTFGLVMSLDCKHADLSVLDKAPGGKILAPLGVSFTIAERSSKHPIAALPFHRAAPGIRSVALAFTSKDDAVVTQAMRPFDYVAICMPPKNVNLSALPLYKKLVENVPVPGLTRVEAQSKSPFRLYVIDANLKNKGSLPGKSKK